MSSPTFVKLNVGWNAEPNDPCETIAVDGDAVDLAFLLNPWAYDASEGNIARLIFTGVNRWRIGSTNEEGWYRGDCRYSGIAPAWGEFYEIVGDDPHRNAPSDWHELAPRADSTRHFLFYLRDSTFECIAADWSFHR